MSSVEAAFIDIVRNGMWEGALGPGATSAATGTLFGGTRDQRIDARRAPSRTEANDSSRRKEPGCDDSEGQGVCAHLRKGRSRRWLWRLSLLRPYGSMEKGRECSRDSRPFRRAARAAPVMRAITRRASSCPWSRQSSRSRLGSEHAKGLPAAVLALVDRQTCARPQGQHLAPDCC
jgi:hypothetical protein